MAPSTPARGSIAPLFLRLALGLIFIWAGLGKFVESMMVKGEPAAVLANMGVITPAERIIEVPKPAESGDQPETPPAPEASPSPASSSPSSPPVPTEPLTPGEKEPEGTDQGTSKASGFGDSRLALMQLTPTSSSKPRAADQTPPPPAVAPVSTATVYTAEDFPEEVAVRKVFGLSLLLHGAVNPGFNEDGTRQMPLWPEEVGKGRWPVYVAWAAALTELVGGLLVLVGLFTRLSALALAGTMAAAMWLTEIGPALQAGHTKLGFLPDYPTFDPASWQPLCFQFSLFMMALALVVLGCGVIGLDRALFSPAASVTVNVRSKPETA